MPARPRFSWLVIAAAAASAVACQDGPTATQVTRPAALDAPRTFLGSQPVEVITVDPRVSNTFVSSEGHRLVIPANAICAVGSGYGPTYWDQPCQPATAPITFTIVSTQTLDGRPRVEVFPDVRFSPSVTATITLRAPAASTNPATTIDFCGKLGCVDEAATDPALVTSHNPAEGTISRRVKHYSGYVVGFGRGGTGLTDGGL